MEKAEQTGAEEPAATSEPVEEQKENSMTDVTGMAAASGGGSLAMAELLARTFLIALGVVCLTIYSVKRKAR